MTLFDSYFKGQVNSTDVSSDLRNLTVEVKSNITYTFAVSIKQTQNYIIIIRTDECRIKNIPRSSARGTVLFRLNIFQ